MSWFAGVPTKVTVTRQSFLPAGQALVQEQTSQDAWPDSAGGERDADDWGAEAVFHLARLQLEQMEELVLLIIGQAEQDEDLSTDEIAERLLARVGALGLPEDDDRAFEAACIEEALALLEALRMKRSALHVSHAFAVDGSISFTAGPKLPDCPALGVRGSSGGELEAEPHYVFDVARQCTQAAAALYNVTLSRSTRDGSANS